MSTSVRLDPSLLTKLEALRLSVRRLRWSARLGGRFAVNRRGSSIEFADYAPYSPGDDIRSIDWKLYARSDRLFVKTYKDEVELTVEVLIDASASMALPSTHKFDRAQQLGLCLAAVAMAGRHYVRFSWIKSGRPSATAWHGQRRGLAHMAQQAASVVPEGPVNLRDWVASSATALRMRGGQVIVISDGMQRTAECFQALSFLLRRQAEVRMIQVLSPHELDPARLFRGGHVLDSETGATHELAYRSHELTQAMREHNERLARFCKRHGIPFAQHRLDEPLAEFVLKTLPARGFLE